MKYRRRHQDLVLIAVCAAAILSAANVASGADIVLDDFADMSITDNDPGNWVPYFNPGIDLSSGDLRLTSPDCCRGVGYSEFITGDVSVRTQFRASSGIAGLTAKFGGGNGNDGYFAWITPSGILGSLARVNGEGFNLGTVAVSIAAGAERDFFFQMDVSDDGLTAWYWPESGPAPASPQLSVPLESHMLIPGGIAGVYVGDQSQFSDVTFRFVQIADGPIAITDPSPPGLPGDFNGDGIVNNADFLILRGNMYSHLDGMTVRFDDGDLDFDYDIDLADFRLFKEQFPAALGAAAGVPEPSTIALVLMGVCGILLHRVTSRHVGDAP